MKLLFLKITIFLFATSIFSQSPTAISGIINDIQAPIININYCTNSVELSNGLENNFSIGDKVFIIQMKGAFLNLEEDSANGTVANYLSAGNYEINEIRTINFGSINGIQFKYNLSREYIPNNGLQIIKIPVYEHDVIVENTLSCLEWNGETGGILIFESKGNVALNANINLDEKGFRGADLIPGLVNECFGFFGFNGYNCFEQTLCGARKGEGIGLLYDGDFFGRGRNGNGGGGGNNQNSGGGGGAGFGNGGQGGNHGEAFCFGLGGFGGEAPEFNNELNKIFMSGGGGSGEQNNEVGTSGGRAGGTAIIIANSLESNGFTISSKGENISTMAGGDGAGGGGAGGLVILDIDDFSGNININLDGGFGGSANDPIRCPGPGGGGGGGGLWLRGNTLPSNINFSADGGITGLLTPNSNPVCANTPYGAEPGEDGGVAFNFEKFVSTTPFIPFTLSAGSNDTICAGEEVDLTASVNGSRTIDFIWNTPEGDFSDFDISASPTQNGMNTYTAVASFEIFNQFCELTEPVNILVRSPEIEIIPDPETMVEPGDPVFLTTIITPSSGDYQFEWQPATLTNPSDAANTVATPFVTQEFCLNIIDNFGCTTVECIPLEVFGVPTGNPTAFTPNNDGINDVFEIFPDPILKFNTLKIYNRWGQLLYESNTNFTWDGTYNGELQEPDVYVWFAELENRVTLKKTFMNGNVHLLK